MSANLKNVVICGYFVNPKYNKEVIFKDWIQNVRQYYLVDALRRYVVYTDNSELLKYESDDLKIVLIQDDDFADIGENRLKKIKYLDILCKDEILDDIDFISFFQSNLRLCNYVYINELIGDDIGISFSLHPEFQKDRDFKKHIRNHFISENSVANINKIDISKYRYFQNGHIFARAVVFRDVIKKTLDLIEQDKRNGVKIIGQPFDERYFNIIVNSKDIPWNIRALDSTIYNSRVRGKNVKIFQINKKTSKMFSDREKIAEAPKTNRKKPLFDPDYDAGW